MTGALDQRTRPGGACGCWAAVLVAVATTACSAHDDKTPTPDENEADVRPGKTMRAPELGEFAPVWHVGDRWTVRERRAQRADPRIKGRIRDVRRERVWKFRVLEIDETDTVTIRAECSAPGERITFTVDHDYRVETTGALSELQERGIPLFDSVFFGALISWPVFPFPDTDRGPWSFSAKWRVSRLFDGAASDNEVHYVRQDVEYTEEGVIVELVDPETPVTIVQHWEPGRPWWTSATVPVFRDECREDLLCFDAEVIHWGDPQTDLPPEP